MRKIGRIGAYLVCVLTIFMIAEFGWLLSDHRRQELLHQEKLARIEDIRDSMTENVGLYRRLVSRLSVMNRQVLGLLADKPEEASAYLTDIEKAWNDEYARRVLEVLDFVKVSATRSKVLSLLATKTGIETVADANQRYNWLGNRLPAPEGAALADYSDFKAILYHRLDPRFLLFFADNPPCDLRLDQVRWNGAMLDGLPPLRDPKMLEARAAFLNDSDRVYSAVIEGRAIACPRSILLWHELVSFKLAERAFTAVYDAVDDTMVLFDMGGGKTAGVVLGNSGFSYQGGSLLYDRSTRSLWSVADGRPVVGRLVGGSAGPKMQLTVLPTTSSTWSDWRARNPHGLLISTDTGYARDYSEAAAERSRLP